MLKSQENAWLKDGRKDGQTLFCPDPSGDRWGSKNSFITALADYADFQYQMRNNFIAHCADYADFQYQMRNNFITHLR